jgi:hypothetical protein
MLGNDGDQRKEDDLLQQQLEALERGVSLDKVLSQIFKSRPEGSSEEAIMLASLVRLADAVRSLPHPEPIPEQARLHETEVKRMASQIRRPSPPPTQPKRPFQWRSLRWAVAPALVGVIALSVIAVVSVLAFGAWLLSPRNVHAATLMDVNGRVEVASGAQATDWKPVSNGDKVMANQRIRTFGASSATLVFFEGSRTTLDQNSDLTLTRVDGDWGNVLRVVLTQNSGESNNSVVPLRGAKSAFIVNTPSGTASVHGTNFNVSVDNQGKSWFSVNRGKVLVTNDLSEVYLTAGQVTTVQSGAAIESPAYQFTLQGSLNSEQGSTWIVAGVPFTVDENTQITGDPQINDQLYVEGRVEDSGEWIANTIEAASDADHNSAFDGVLQSMTGNIWQIGGWTVQVDKNTEVDSDLQVGDAVRVTFTIRPNGRWLATNIQGLEETPEEPTATATATPDPNAEPNLVFNPEEFSTEGCVESYDLTGYLDNAASAEKDVAANVELGYQVINGAEFVNQVELNPTSWEQIAAGEQVQFNIHVLLDGSAWQEAPEGSEVQLRIFVAHETNRPDNLNAHLTVTIASNCQEEPSETETPTPVITTTVTPTTTVTVTPTVTLTPTPTGTITTTVGTEAINCTGAQPHPTGMTLSVRYGVPYEEIMGWFCQGFGFGEIDLAYSLSLQSGKPVAEIFAMKQSGMGWGVIKKQLQSQPASTETPNGNPNSNPSANPPGKWKGKPQKKTK